MERFRSQDRYRLLVQESAKKLAEEYIEANSIRPIEAPDAIDEFMERFVLRIPSGPDDLIGAMLRY